MYLVGAEIYDLDVGQAKFLDAGDLVVVEAEDLEVGEVLQAGSVQVCQLVEGDVQGSKRGRERCQELMDSCEERILWIYMESVFKAKVKNHLVRNP